MNQKFINQCICAIKFLEFEGILRTSNMKSFSGSGGICLPQKFHLENPVRTLGPGAICKLKVFSPYLYYLYYV